MSPSTGGSLGGNPSYYFVKGPTQLPTSQAFFINNITPLDITTSAYTTAGESPTYPNRVEINFYSDVAAPALSPGQQVVVTIQSYPLTTSPIHPAPIATVNGIACSDTNCQGQNALISPNGHYYAVRYTPQTTIRIGFYPQDICADYLAAGSDAVGCTSGSVNTVSDTVSTTMQLQFTVTVAADTSSYPQVASATTPSPAPSTTSGAAVPVGAVLDQSAAPMSYIFENVISTLVCPPLSTLDAAVTPGDGQIFLDTTGFSFSTLNGSTGAPGAGLVVVGQDERAKGGGVAPDLSSGYATNNSLVQHIGLGNSLTPVTGFTNSTAGAGNDHKYRVSFLGQDQAGVYLGPPNPVSACTLYPVETASIQGFLGKSNCFIATAAFGDVDAVPVELLREFRDSVLLFTPVGRSFVHWYYSWSPAAAEWLLLHPVFRLPVLLFLFPLEAIAWLYLHSGWLFVALVSLGIVLVFASFKRVLLIKKQKGIR